MKKQYSTTINSYFLIINKEDKWYDLTQLDYQGTPDDYQLSNVEKPSDLAMEWSFKNLHIATNVDGIMIYICIEPQLMHQGEKGYKNDIKRLLKHLPKYLTILTKTQCQKISDKIGKELKPISLDLNNFKL